MTFLKSALFPFKTVCILGVSTLKASLFLKFKNNENLILLILIFIGNICWLNEMNKKFKWIIDQQSKIFYFRAISASDNQNIFIPELQLDVLHAFHSE